MPISRATFNKQNTVLFKAKVFDIGKSTHAAIDVDGNGDLTREVTTTGFASFVYTAQEPTLSVSLKTLKRQIHNMGKGSVATDSELSSVKALDITMNSGVFSKNRNQIKESNRRSLGELADELAPLGDNKQVAIDTDAQEFLIYTPRES